MKNDEKIIARLIANTKRIKRQNSILEIASDIEVLKKELGSIQRVSDLIGVSAGMLNKFLAVKKLANPLQQHIKSRKIDSVEAVANLAKFNFNEQEKLANLLAEGTINSQDLRLVHPLMKAYPNLEVEELARMILESKDKKISVISFDKSNLKRPLSKVRKNFEIMVGLDGLVGIEMINGTGKIRLSKKGEKALRQIAKESRTTLGELVQNLL